MASVSNDNAEESAPDLDSDSAASTRRWRILAEGSSETVMVIREGRVIDCNPMGPELFGCKRDQLIGRLVPGQLVHEDFREEVARRVRGRIPGVFEAAIVDAAGTTIPVEVRARELDIEGEKCRVVALRDLRERKAAEEQVREAGERMRALLETAFDGVLVSRAGFVIEANEGFARMCGYELHEVEGMLPSAVTTPESAAIIAENIRNRVHTPYVVTGVRKDGSTFPMEIQGQECVYRGEQLRITGFRDLSQRMAQERERRELEQRVYQAQRVESVGMLAGGIAHDFNNLLVGILGNIELAELNLISGKDVRASLGRIRQAASRAAELTQQLLTYAGRQVPERQPVLIEPLIRATAELLRSTLPAGHTLRFGFPDVPLPAVLADLAQVSQIILNLLTNAIEAMDGLRGTITVRARVVEIVEQGNGTLPGPPGSPGSYVCISVVDQGSGMDAPTRARMFDPFFSTRGTGRGLGLAAVLGIVRSHGGGITVECAPENGTTIEVYLPVATDIPETDTPSSEDATSTRHLNILLVDDEPWVLEVGRELLTSQNHAVLAAASGEEGLRLWAEHRGDIDAVVLDVCMPGVDGEEVYRRLVADDPDIRVLFCSGFQPSGNIARLTQKGAAGFLPKPYRAVELFGALARLVERSAH